jgi:hypothetical protein
LNIGDEHGYSLISSDLLQPLHGALDADRLTAQAGQDVTQHVEGGLVVNDEYNTRHLPAASINGRMTPPRGLLPERSTGNGQWFPIGRLWKAAHVHGPSC